VLDGYGNDPRTVDKLTDGHNHTCDDMHAWLAPFEQVQGRREGGLLAVAGALRAGDH
jgi:hypothetical protein